MISVSQMAEAAVERHKLHAPVGTRQRGLQIGCQARIARANVKSARVPCAAAGKIAVQQMHAARYASQPAVDSPQVVKTLPDFLGCAEVIVKPFLRGSAKHGSHPFSTLPAKPPARNFLTRMQCSCRWRVQFASGATGAARNPDRTPDRAHQR